jgi:hypothetical protein
VSAVNTAPAQVKVSVAPGIAAAFKDACASSGDSMASVLTRFMVGFSNCNPKPRAAPEFSTRRERRRVVRRIILELEQIKAAKERLVGNAPENLQDAPVYETAGEYIDALDEAIAALLAMVP